MTTKVLTLNTDGSLLEVTPDQTSAGASSSGHIPGLNASGKLDISFMPAGVGGDTQTINATESITAGSFVNIYNNAGSLGVRNAVAADNTKPANGFVLSGYTSSQAALVYLQGLNTLVPLGSFTAANVGQKVFLSPTTSGGCQTAIPATTGQIAQVLGTVEAVGATVTVNFTETPFTVRA